MALIYRLEADISVYFNMAIFSLLVQAVNRESHTSVRSSVIRLSRRLAGTCRVRVRRAY